MTMAPSKVLPTILLTAALCATGRAEPDAGVLQIPIDGRNLVSYQAAPMIAPKGGAIFINFNSAQEESWTFLPGRKYTRRYRLFIYDGTVSAKQAETLWNVYMEMK